MFSEGVLEGMLYSDNLISTASAQNQPGFYLTIKGTKEHWVELYIRS